MRSNNKNTGTDYVCAACNLDVTDMYCYMEKRNNSHANVFFYPLIGIWQTNEMAGDGELFQKNKFTVCGQLSDFWK